MAGKASKAPKDTTRKEVYIPNNQITDLKTVAFHAELTVKKYMEKAILDKIKEDIKKLKK